MRHHHAGLLNHNSTQVHDHAASLNHDCTASALLTGTAVAVHTNVNGVICQLSATTGCMSVCVSAAKGAVDAGPDEGGALGADSDEEEKRANRARAASKDPGSAAESRNQGAATDVCPPLLRFCCASAVVLSVPFSVRPICGIAKASQHCNTYLSSAFSVSVQSCLGC